MPNDKRSFNLKPAKEEKEEKKTLAEHITDQLGLPKNFVPRGTELGVQSVRVEVLSSIPTKTQATMLNTLLPSRIWKFYGDLHGHLTLNTISSEAHRRMRKLIPADRYFLEIGGRPTFNAKHGIFNSWSCNPTDLGIAKDYLRSAAVEENRKIADEDQKTILSNTCPHKSQDCDCVMPDELLPYAALSLHSLYHLTPLEIAETILRTESKILLAAMYNYSHFPHDILGEQRCSYSNLRVHDAPESYVDCTVESLNVDDLQPYSHPALLWLSKGQIVVSDTHLLAWTCSECIGPLFLFEFTCVPRPPTPIVSSQPSTLPVLSAISDMSFSGKLDYRNANTSGMPESTILEVQQTSFSHLTNFGLNTKENLLIIPKSAVSVLALKMNFKTRSHANLMALSDKAQFILKKYNVTPDQLALAVSFIVLLACDVNIQTEALMTQHFSMNHQEKKAHLERSKLQYENGFDFIDRTAQFFTRGRIMEIPPNYRFGLAVGAAVLATVTLPITLPLLTGLARKTITKSAWRILVGATVKQINYTSPAIFAVGVAIWTTAVHSAVKAEAKPFFAPLNPTTTVQVGVQSKALELTFFQPNREDFTFDNYPLPRSTVSSCMEERPLKPLPPSSSLTVSEHLCVPTQGTTLVGLGVPNFVPQLPRKCTHNIQNAINTRLLSINEPRPAGVIWDDIFDLSLQSAPLDPSLDFATALGTVKLDMKVFSARSNVPPAKMAKWIAGRKNYKLHGFSPLALCISIMLKMENTVKVSPTGTETFDLRCICVLSDEVNGYVNPWLWTLQKNLVSQWNGLKGPHNPRWMFFTSGSCSEDIGARFQDAYETLTEKGVVYFFYSDSSRHDKHMDGAKQQLAEQLMKFKGIPDDVVHISQRFQYPRGSSYVGKQHDSLSKGAVSFRVAPNPDPIFTSNPTLFFMADPVGYRAYYRQYINKWHKLPTRIYASDHITDVARESTGHGGTTLYNTTTIQATHDAFFHEQGFTPETRFIISIGDDNATLLMVPSFPIAIRETFPCRTPTLPFTNSDAETFFMNRGLKVEVGHSLQLTQIEFCSQMFLDTNDGWILTPLIGRIFAKLMYCWKNYSTMEYYEWLLTVCLGMRRDTAHCPVLRVLIPRTIELCISKGVSPCYEKYLDSGFLLYKSHCDGFHQATDATFLALAERYNILPSDLKDLETLLTVSYNHIPSVLHHPILQIICERDVGYAALVRFGPYVFLSEPCSLGPMQLSTLHTDVGELLGFFDFINDRVIHYLQVPAIIQVAEVAFTAPLIEECLKIFEPIPGFSFFGLYEFVSRVTVDPSVAPLALLPFAMHCFTTRYSFKTRLAMHVAYNVAALTVTAFLNNPSTAPLVEKAWSSFLSVLGEATTGLIALAHNASHAFR